MLYKFPLCLNFTHLDHWEFCRANVASGGGIISFIHQRQPSSVRGYMWEMVDHFGGRDIFYYHLLLDAEGAALLALGHPDLWKPEELFDNPEWSRTIAP